MKMGRVSRPIVEEEALSLTSFFDVAHCPLCNLPTLVPENLVFPCEIHALHWGHSSVFPCLCLMIAPSSSAKQRDPCPCGKR
jgi:hypothetical protein